VCESLNNLSAYTQENITMKLERTLYIKNIVLTLFVHNLDYSIAVIPDPIISDADKGSY
jgi:hypothetical protein